MVLAATGMNAIDISPSSSSSSCRRQTGSVVESVQHSLCDRLSKVFGTLAEDKPNLLIHALGHVVVVGHEAHGFDHVLVLLLEGFSKLRTVHSHVVSSNRGFLEILGASLNLQATRTNIARDTFVPHGYGEHLHVTTESLPTQTEFRRVPGLETLEPRHIHVGWHRAGGSSLLGPAQSESDPFVLAEPVAELELDFSGEQQVVLRNHCQNVGNIVDDLGDAAGGLEFLEEVAVALDGSLTGDDVLDGDLVDSLIVEAKNVPRVLRTQLRGNLLVLGWKAGLNHRGVVDVGDFVWVDELHLVSDALDQDSLQKWELGRD